MNPLASAADECKPASVEIRDEGTVLGRVSSIDLVGAGVVATVIGDVATLTIGGGSGVPTSRLINTTAPLAGGGDLTADRTLTTSMATNKLIGRATAGTGVMEEITLGTNLSFTGTTLNAAGGASDGLGPDGDKGDVTVGGTGTTLTIDNDAVSYAKMQNVSAASKLLGRGDSGAGDPQEITLGTNLSMSGTTLNAAGGAGASWTETEIDFGTSPAKDKTFVITDAGVSSSSKILIVPSGNVATGRVGDDWEWDGFTFSGKAATGQFTLTALAQPGPVVGKRKVFYSVAA